MVFNGAMALGSLGWGLIAQGLSLPTAILLAAVGLTATALVAHRLKLPRGEANLEPSNHWPEPLGANTVATDRGPVLVHIEYRVQASDRSRFLALLKRLSDGRRRDGAYAWGIAEDTTDPERLLEWFFVESWAEHLRQHRRVSHDDADLQAGLMEFQIGRARPVVRHFLTV